MGDVIPVSFSRKNSRKRISKSLFQTEKFYFTDRKPKGDPLLEAHKIIYSVPEGKPGNIIVHELERLPRGSQTPVRLKLENIIFPGTNREDIKGLVRSRLFPASEGVLSLEARRIFGSGRMPTIFYISDVSSPEAKRKLFRRRAKRGSILGEKPRLQLARAIRNSVLGLSHSLRENPNDTLIVIPDRGRSSYRILKFPDIDDYVTRTVHNIFDRGKALRGIGIIGAIGAMGSAMRATQKLKKLKEEGRL